MRKLTEQEAMDLAARGVSRAPGVLFQTPDRSWWRIAEVRAPHVGHVEVYVTADSEPGQPIPPKG